MREQGYRPIDDYAFIGDGRTGALISSGGAVDWLCLPEFFSESLFAALLDPARGGTFIVRPAGRYSVRRRYLDDTAVLQTTYRCPDGVFRVTDCMPVAAGRDQAELQPERELLREIEVLEGGPRIEVIYAPRPGYGKRPPSIVRRGHGWFCSAGGTLYVLRTELPLALSEDGASVAGRIRLPAGERRCLSLSCTERDVAVLPALGPPAVERRRATEAWWREWSEGCAYDGPYRSLVMRSAVTLKLLSYSLSGAVIAAPTTSLPEHIGGSRNWDYRYCWPRDAAFTLRAFMDLGYTAEGKAFLGWLLHATRLTWPKLQVLYGVYGRQPAPERELHWLSGYRGSKPVRVGNAAAEQIQLDLYGVLLLAAHDYVERGGRLDYQERRLLRGFGSTICSEWQRPDSSIWEVRGAPRHYTYSKLMCWAGLNCLIRLHEAGHMDKVPVERYRRVRSEIEARIEAEAYDPALNAYVGVFNTQLADAALLQLGLVGYRPPDCPKLEGSYRFIWRRLSRNGLLLRYAADFDPSPEPEGAFGVCSFWAVSHLVRSGHVEEARRLFERAAACANDLGLFSEEFDPATGAALGNFPQAFTHVGLIDAAVALAQARKQERKRA